MTDNVTPAQLREDAVWFREDIVAYAWNVRVPDSELERLARAAAALERWAVALEQGERVCRWTVPQGFDAWLNCIGRHIAPGTAGQYCTDCGGRVVLGYEEASDE